jgi:hypothetical protein
MSGYKVLPSKQNKQYGAHTRPASILAPPKPIMPPKQSGEGLQLAGSGTSIQSIIAEEMFKGTPPPQKSGSGVSITPINTIGSAPHASQPGGGLYPAGGALRLAGEGLRLAGQRHQKKGCGDAAAPMAGELLKIKLDKMIKRRKKGGALNFPILPGDKMESKESDSRGNLNHFIKKVAIKSILPSLHQSVGLPQLSKEKYANSVDMAGGGSFNFGEMDDIKKFAKTLALTHMPRMLKLYKKMGGSGMVIKKPVVVNLAKKMALPIFKMILDNMKNKQSGGKLIGSKTGKFLRSFAKGFLEVLGPVVSAGGATVATMLGQPELAPFAPMVGTAISGLSKRL